MKRVYRDVAEIVENSGEIHRPSGAKVTIETESTEGVVDNGYFCKLWLNSGIETLEDSEISFLVKISQYLDYRDNTIRREGEVMTVKEMAEVTGREYTRLSKMVKGMCERKIMGKHSTEMVEYLGRRSVVYSVNPYVICRGRMINKRVRTYYNNG